MNGQVTFWKSDFAGDNYDQLIEILKHTLVRAEGIGLWSKQILFAHCFPKMNTSGLWQM